MVSAHKSFINLVKGHATGVLEMADKKIASENKAKGRKRSAAEEEEADAAGAAAVYSY